MNLKGDPPQLPHSLAATSPGDDAAKARPGKLVPLVSLDEHPLQSLRICSACQVQQHPLHRRDRDASLAGAFVLAQPSSLVKANASVAVRLEAARLPQHLDWSTRAAQSP